MLFGDSDMECSSSVFDNNIKEFGDWFTMKSQQSGKRAFVYEDEDCGLGMDELDISFNSSWSSLSSHREPLEHEPETMPPRKRRRTDSGCDVTFTSSPLSDIICAVDRLSTYSNLIADGTRPNSLPTISDGKHKDLSAITPETMADVIEGQYNRRIDHVTIIDCRYPYEYEGGHIKGAINLYTKDSIQEYLNDAPVAPCKTHLLIFHCEFSSERGPKIDTFCNEIEKFGHWSIMKSQQSVKEAFFYEDEDSGLGMDELEMSFDNSWSSLITQSEPLEQELDTPPPRKRRRTDTGCDVTFTGSPQSEIIRAVDRLSTDSKLVADGTRTNSLPTISGGKHKDLSAITPETMADVIEGYYDEQINHVTTIDCRYPYEYEGGHIKGAINLYTKDSIQDFLNDTTVVTGKTHVLIFHCEFSSERGPKMHRFLRSLDRELNKDSYPRLNFPEMYLLEGGYKDFFQTNEVLCKPNTYTPMLHKEHTDDLRHFRVKSKSWSAGDKARPRSRLTGGLRLKF